MKAPFDIAPAALQKIICSLLFYIREISGKTIHCQPTGRGDGY